MGSGRNHWLAVVGGMVLVVLFLHRGSAWVPVPVSPGVVGMRQVDVCVGVQVGVDVRLHTGQARDVVDRGSTTRRRPVVPVQTESVASDRVYSPRRDPRQILDSRRYVRRYVAVARGRRRQVVCRRGVPVRVHRLAGSRSLLTRFGVWDWHKVSSWVRGGGRASSWVAWVSWWPFKHLGKMVRPGRCNSWIQELVRAGWPVRV